LARGTGVADAVLSEAFLAAGFTAAVLGCPRATGLADFEDTGLADLAAVVFFVVE
jgi:hypothetical protein